MLTSWTLFTWKQKAELWERWKNGQSVLAISRGLERRDKYWRPADRGSPWRYGACATSQSCGGVEACRSAKRFAWNCGRSVDTSDRAGLGRSPSTLSRGIQTQRGLQTYRANRADRRARRGRCAKALSPGAP